MKKKREGEQSHVMAEGGGVCYSRPSVTRPGLKKRRHLPNMVQYGLAVLISAPAIGTLPTRAGSVGLGGNEGAMPGTRLHIVGVGVWVVSRSRQWAVPPLRPGVVQKQHNLENRLAYFFFLSFFFFLMILFWLLGFPIFSCFCFRSSPSL